MVTPTLPTTPRRRLFQQQQQCFPLSLFHSIPSTLRLLMAVVILVMILMLCSVMPDPSLEVVQHQFPITTGSSSSIPKDTTTATATTTIKPTTTTTNDNNKNNNVRRPATPAEEVVVSKTKPNTNDVVPAKSKPLVQTTTTTTFAPVAPPPPAVTTASPVATPNNNNNNNNHKKFLTFHRFPGRINNQWFQVVAGLQLSTLLNRTLIVPPEVIEKERTGMFDSDLHWWDLSALYQEYDLIYQTTKEENQEMINTQIPQECILSPKDYRNLFPNLDATEYQHCNILDIGGAGGLLMCGQHKFCGNAQQQRVAFDAYKRFQPGPTIKAVLPSKQQQEQQHKHSFKVGAHSRTHGGKGVDGIEDNFGVCYRGVEKTAKAHMKDYDLQELQSQCMLNETIPDDVGRFLLASDGVLDWSSKQPVIVSDSLPEHLKTSLKKTDYTVVAALAELFSLVDVDYFYGNIYSTFTLSVCMLRGEERKYQSSVCWMLMHPDEPFATKPKESAVAVTTKINNNNNAVSTTTVTTTNTNLTTQQDEIEKERLKKEFELNANQMFIVGIMFTGAERYLDSIQAEAETWMQYIPQNRIFAIGPDDAAGKRPNMPRLVKNHCPDRELWCKRIFHIVEAYKMLQNSGTNTTTTHFDWLLSGNEDWYVHLPAMRRTFAKKDPNEAVVYVNYGCGQAWEYHARSKNNTIPKPDNWPVRQQCKALSIHGGVCGGDGIVFSRKAIEIMMADGEEALFELVKSQPFNWDAHPQGDPVLSCTIYAFNGKVRIEDKPWHGSVYQRFLKVGPIERKETIGTVHASLLNGLTAAEILHDVHKTMKDLQ